MSALDPNWGKGQMKVPLPCSRCGVTIYRTNSYIKYAKQYDQEEFYCKDCKSKHLSEVLKKP